MNQGRRSVLGMVMLGAMEPLFAAPPAPGASLRALDAELAAIAEDPAMQLASLSVLAIRAGRPVYEAAFGRRTIGPDRPAAPSTLYRIASVSKLHTTLGLMRLVEDGKLDLDADVSGYLGFPLRNPHFPKQPISLRLMLSHTSSLRDDGGYSWPNTTALKDVLAPGATAMWSAQAAPGEYFTYCNLGWGIIGTVMERVTGERFNALMQRLLFQPLGIEAAYHPSELPPAALANLATLYRKRTTDTEIWDAAGPWIAQVDDYHARPPARLDGYVPGVNATPYSPTGGLRISARGLGVVMRMLMQDGMHGGTRILKRETLERMFARQWTFDPARRSGNGNGATLDGFYQAWGLGNQHFPDKPGMRLAEGFDAVGHLGDAYGLRSVFAFERASGNGMVVLVGGSSADPEAQKGSYSALARFEERILTALHRHAILGTNVGQ
ncbi:serine hydrolase [Massilia sp. ST3]|uniref:serine hydrolase domain-containing protein n=1 Tax=Massilia sp. ST3 TaxID=2824903 RepID=UPI001E37C347|nr:serine hydrolase [Massilia sp. ST3]